MDATKNTTHVGTEEDFSLFQMKYVEFVEDALGAFPEYRTELEVAKGMAEKERIERFRKEVHQVEPFVAEEKEEARHQGNPGTILPGVVVSDGVWSAVSEGTKRAVWEHLRILSICCMMEMGVEDGTDAKPAWMEDMMKEMKEKWESVDMEEMMKKFSRFFSSNGDEAAGAAAGGAAAGAEAGGAGFPRLPERFLKGQLAKLAQEIVKDITPEDLGITPEQIAECENQPSNAFRVLFGTFTKNPGVLQRTISKIGKRLQQKIVSGAIRPQEIAREAEELMKEFAGNASFVEMMEGLKSAFGMEDMETARSAGRESSARLALVRDRLRRKLEKGQAQQKGQAQAQQKGQAQAQQKGQAQSTNSVPKKKK
jgi:hypothetical protein